MRMAKVKSKRDVVMTLDHNTRERMPPNADPQRSAQNWNFGGSTSETMNRFNTLCPEKVRANAVMAVELVFTASPDFKGDWSAYLKASGEWAMKLFGAENLLHITHHYDESTPHAHVLFIPEKDGKLNAKHFIGGHRDRMAELQDDFYENVGKRFELERGQSKSESRERHSHHTLSGKAAELDEREEKIKLREKVLREHELQFEDFKAELKQLFGMKPADVRKLKTLSDNWDKTTPAGLRVIARDIEQSGAATVGEYRTAREAQREKQQSRSSSFSH